MRIVNFCSLCDGFTVRNLGSTDRALNVKFTLHTVDNDLKVQFSHSFDNSLASFLVSRESERRIFGGKTDQGLRHLLLISLCLRFNGNLDDRFREFHFLKNNGVFLVTESFSSSSILKTNKGNNITGDSGLDLSSVIGVHLKHTSNSLVLSLDRVVNSGTGLHDPRVNASKGERSDERVGGDLEGKSRHGLDIGRVSLDWFSVFGNTSDGQNIKGRRHVVNDSIQQRLDSLVLKGSSGQNGNKVQVESTLSDQLLESGHIWFLSLQVCHENVLILLHCSFNKLVMPFLCLGLQFVVDKRDIIAFIKGDDIERSTKILTTPYDGFHGDKVDDTKEVGFSSDGQLQNSRCGSKKIDDGVDAEIKVRTSSVHLVQEAHTRDLVFVGLSPDCFGLWFNTGNTIKDSDSTVKNSKRTFNLQGEIDVARSVDDIDTVVLPRTGGGSGGDSDTTLLLLFHPVHCGATLVHFTDFV
mmetsp:Transcript_132112/g.381949  ORF Transcript_132112/g.381949 Transcript_132112/m.381949 type:complete len:468 (-) Transcript_132112:328-1731(-)